MTIELSERALTLIREFEGLRLTAYRDPVGIWTIGYGHTGPVADKPIRSGMKITHVQADTLLREDVAVVAGVISAAVKVALTAGQFGALVSFAYNVGWGALRQSTLWKCVQAGDMTGAAVQFGRWTKAGKPPHELPGLVRRRKAERELFESDVSSCHG